MDGLSLAAVQDASPKLAREVGERHGVPHTVGYEDLLEMGLDAVVVSTPNALHAAQAAAALRAGLDVLVQKPLATTAPDARTLVALARESGRVLFVDHTYRFLETTVAFQRAFERDRPAGPITAVFHNVYGPGKAWSRDPALAGGGALMDLGVHLIDLALLLTRPADVHLRSAVLGRARGLAVEDDARLVLDLDGRAVEVHVSWEAEVPATEIALRCGGGPHELAWENVDGSFYRFRARRGSEVLIDRETTLRADTLRAFAAALADRRPPPIDLRVHELIDAAYRTGR